MTLQDYILAPDSADWQAALANWSWLVPPSFTIWVINRFCDLFIVTPDGAIHILDVGRGTLSKVADDRAEFARKLDEANNADEWLMMPLVDQLVALGTTLLPGQCYGFRIPPVMGGRYSVENCAAISIPDYLGATASIHKQLRDVPDGSPVVLRTTNLTQ